jgi:RNA polymerase sigma-70 factor (ECF subfamily)
MNSPEPQSNGSHSGGKWFEPTQWTVILKARQEGVPGAAEALNQFAQSYWTPLYCFIRREGYSRHDAEDLTQEFYRHFQEKHLLGRVTERNGKFRNYLLTCLKNFLFDERDRAKALKRGGGKTIISLNALEAEELDAVEPSDSMTPDENYDRQWAQEIMTRAIEQLRCDYASRGKTALFDHLKELQPGERGEQSCAQIGAALGMSEQAVKSARHHFQRSYARHLREEVARTVGASEEIAEELAHLFSNHK